MNTLDIDGVTLCWHDAPGTGPRPLLMLLVLSAEETLIHPLFGRIGRLLAADGWLVSALDLPCHGTDVWPASGHGLNGWAEIMQRDSMDLFLSWNAYLERALQALADVAEIDTSRIVLAGTSRGGFAALQAAARIPAIRAVIAFAPVVDLQALAEFAHLRDAQIPQDTSILPYAEALARKPLWAIIGSHDERVGTSHVVHLCTAISDIAAGQNLAANLHFQVADSPGHESDPRWHEMAANWLRESYPGPGTQNGGN